MSARDYGEEDPRDMPIGWDEPPECEGCGVPTVGACQRCAKRVGTTEKTCGWHGCNAMATRALVNFWGSPSGPLVGVLNQGGGVIAVIGSPHLYVCDEHAAMHDARPFNRSAQSVSIDSLGAA